MMTSTKNQRNGYSLHSMVSPKSSEMTILFLLLVLFLPTIMSLNTRPIPSEHSKRTSSSKAGVSTMHIAVAFSETHAQTFLRVFNKSIINATGMLANVTISPLVISLPEDQRFSAGVLERTCALLEGKYVIAVMILGSSPAGLSVALAAATSGIPVLWAREETGDLSGYLQPELSPLEVRLEPSSREVLESVRALLLATHWHTFSVLADNSGILLRRDLARILNTPPLNPNIMLLPSTPPRRSIFRHLAEISRLTRGVVLLICDVTMARLITSEGRRLNMLSGHFIWLWVDTGSTLQPQESVSDTNSPTNLKNSTSSSTTSPFVATPFHPAVISSKGKPVYRQSSSPSGGRRPRSDEIGHYSNKEIYVVRHIRSASSTRTSWSFISSSSGKVSGSDNRERRNGADVSEKDMINIKQSFTSAAYGGYFINLDPNQAGKHETFPAIAQERISDHLNFKDLNRNPKNRKGPDNIVREDEFDDEQDEDARLPIGLLALRTLPLRLDHHLIKSAVRLLADTLVRVMAQCEENGWLLRAEPNHSCWKPYTSNFSTLYARELKVAVRDALAGRGDKATVATFDVLNLVQSPDQHVASIPQTLQLQDGEGSEGWWRVVGSVTGRLVHLDTIVWPGGNLVVTGLSPRARSVFRIVTALAPPFVMEGELDEDGQCLRGLPCHRVLTSDKDNLTLVFNELETQERLEEGNEELGTAVDEDATLSTSTGKRADATRTPLVNDPDSRQHHHRGGSSAAIFTPYFKQRYRYRTNCCYGLSMDLLENVAHELEFDFHLYIVADGLFGTKTRGEEPVTAAIRHANGGGGGSGFKPDQPRSSGSIRDDIRRGGSESGGVGGGASKWNGIVGDLVSGAAHMSFAALSVSSARSEVIDFSVPYFFSGVSFLAAPTQKSEIPLLAFLLPFSPELWIAIFTSLNITAMAVAVYEWLSPFGLNPWGRQRSKNFSIASALWVMWGLLCGHLVAFKAPKSWPNKFLINVWGGFSVIFVASYTANIAALIAGLFFHNAVSNYHDRSLLSQKVGAPKASAADYYVHRANQHLWEHMQKYAVKDVEEGIHHLKNGSLDILIADTPILDYYRATDHGCKLQKIGDAINEDTYAVGMTKGFPLKDSISAVIAKYSSNGYMDILQEKWYGALPCFKLATDMAQPRPLGVAAVAGVFILLGLGMVLGCLILIFEHLFYRYTLPILRHQPKGTIWRSRNIMFFSQKLYRFINCVELVSPHHAARELVHTIRQGQITSLFQKSVKRKEHEQRRRRKSKAQFFEMIQEIRRVQQEGRNHSTSREHPGEPEAQAGRQTTLQKCDHHSGKNLLSPSLLQSKSQPSKISPRKLEKLRSPRSTDTLKFYKEIFSPTGTRKSKSPSSSRRASTDMILSPLRPRLDCPSSAVGRRLSKDSGGCSSPPDINSRKNSFLDVSAKQDKLSALDMRFQQGRSHLDVRLPIETHSSGLNLSTIPRLGSVSNTNISSSNVKHEIGVRRMEVSSVQERLNTIGSRLGSLSSSDISFGPQNLSRSHSKSPIPSMINLNIPSPTEIKPKPSTTLRVRERIRSETNVKDAMLNRPKLKTPSPTEIKVDKDHQSKLNSTSRRSQRVENQKIAQDEIKPAPENEGNTVQLQKLKQSDLTLPYESIIEVNVTCCDSTPEKVTKDISSTHQTKLKCQDTLTRSQEQIHICATSPNLYNSLRKSQFKRRQSHQPRLETTYTPHHQIISPTSSSQSSTKEFLAPVQRHDNSSSSSSSRSPVRRRYQSHPVRSEASPKQLSAIASSSSIPDMSTAQNFNHQKHHHGRHHRDSSYECDEVFENIPPPPPPPSFPARNVTNGESPLDRLNKEELVALWRSSESELRSHLLRAIRAKEVNDPP